MKRLLTMGLAAGIIAGIAAAIAVLLYGESTLQWTFKRIQNYLPGQITVERLSGRLAGPLVITGLHYENDSLVVRADTVTLRWQPGRLVDGIVVIETLALSGLELTTKETQAPSGGEFSFTLPLPIEMRRFSAGPITLHRPGQDPVIIDALELSATARDGSVTLSKLRLTSPQFNIDADGKLPLNRQDPLQLGLHWQTTVQERTITGDGTAGGTWRHLTSEMHITQPLALTVAAQIDTGDDLLHWRLHAVAEPFAPSALLPQAPPGRVSDAVLEIDGNGTTFTADGGLTWHDEHYGRWTVALNAAWDGTRWEVPQFHLKAADGTMQINGRAQAQTDDGGRYTFLVDAHWQDLAWPPDKTGRTLSPQGTLSIAGNSMLYAFKLEGALHPPNTPPLKLILSGRGDRSGLAIEELGGDWLDGAWSGRGSFSWSPALRWDLALAGQHVNPAALKEGFDGNLDTAARIRGEYADASLTLDVYVDKLTGTLRGYPVSAHTQIALHQGEIRIDGLELQSGAATLAANARFGTEWQLDWQLHAPVLAELYPGLSGSLQTQGHLSGPPAALRTRIELEARQLGYRDMYAVILQVRADIDMAPAGHWQIFARADEAGLHDMHRGRLTLEGSGTSQDHTLHLSGEQDGYRLEQQLSGSLHDRRWQARLHDGRLDLAALGPFVQENTAGLTASPDELALEPWCWRQDATVLCLAGDGNPAAAALQGKLHWQQLKLASLSTLLPLSGIELGGTSTAELEVSIAAGRIRALNLKLDVDAGTVSYPLPMNANTSQRHTLAYRQASIAVAGDGGDGLRADVRIDIDADTRLYADLRLPQWYIAAQPFSAQQVLAGRVELDLADLSLISLFLPDLLPGPGNLQARFVLSGTLAEPRVDGQLDVALSTLAVTRLGISLRDVNLHVQSEQNRWQLQGDLRSGAGRLTLDGSGFIQDSRHWEGTLALNGDGIEIIRLPAAAITASPAITLHILPGDLAFAGTLGIPKAQLEPVMAETGTGASEDVVIVGGEARGATTPRLHIHGNLELILGDEVRLAAKGLQGRLTGRVRILMIALDDINGQGEIRLVEGRYRAYGQNLSIDQGRVLYAGGPIDNPALDIIASRQRGEDIRVGVRVTGTAKHPLVQLFSEPAMDDGDVLSYIILGHPLGQASATEGRALYQAATSIALIGGEALAGRIGGIFNLSDVSIEAGETTADTALVLGKSLSPRIYIRYIQGLVENTAAFQIRYRLSDKWTVETESGTRSGSGADLIYSFER